METGYRESVKEFVSHFYSQPLGEKVHLLNDSTIVNDSLFFKRLDIEARIERINSELNYKYDSILFAASGLQGFPEYKPENYSINDKYDNGDFYMVLTRRISAYGVHEVYIIVVREINGNYEVLKKAFSVDPECSLIIEQKDLSVDCFKLTSTQNSIHPPELGDNLLAMYNDFDISRLSFYNHQSQMICDGYTYSIRMRNKWKDKSVTVDCPGSRNPIYQFYELINEI